MKLVRQDQRFSSISSTWEPYYASFQTFLSSTFSDKNNHCSRLTNKQTFPIWYFSHPSSNRTTSNCLSHNNPANGCPNKFRSRSTTGSSMCAQDFGRVIWERLPVVLGCKQILHQLLVRHNLHYFCGSHLGRRRALFSKKCKGFRVVFHNVTPEHDSAFVFL